VGIGSGGGELGNPIWPRARRVTDYLEFGCHYDFPILILLTAYFFAFTIIYIISVK